MLALVVPVATAGLAVLAAACTSFALSAPPAGRLAAVGALVVGGILLEAFPVPIEGIGTLSLAAIAVVGTSVLYGWEAATLVAFVAHAAYEGAQRRAWFRIAYNGAMYAFGGAAAGAAVALVGNRVPGALVAQVAVATLAFYAPLVLLVSAVVSVASGRSYRDVLREGAKVTAPSFGIMGSAGLMLAVLWRQSPGYTIALAGPLLATALYQRSTHRTLQAMRLALTDPLTGLGNHRHFHEQLQRELEQAAQDGTQLSLCLFDLDDFKHINDTYGHPVGDRVLADVAACLRHGGEAFRLGGDEFALLVPRHSEAAAAGVAEAVLARLAGVASENGERVTFSAGLATYPHHAVERTDLLRVADAALYVAKRRGKNQLGLAEPAVAA